MSSDSPRVVFERLLAGLTKGGDPASLPDLYADDVVVEQPFALPEAVRIEGKDALRRHFAGNAGRVELTARDVVVHETSDPEVIIAEYDYELRVPGRDEAVTVSNIQVVRVRDGLIVATRDYHDHAGIARALTP